MGGHRQDDQCQNELSNEQNDLPKKSGFFIIIRRRPASDNFFVSIWARREDNLAFLRRTLSADYVTQKLDQAAVTLAGCEEAALARRAAGDAKTRAEIIAIRIDDLLENLSRVQLAKGRWE
jgi:hypothetical protein